MLSVFIGMEQTIPKMSADIRIKNMSELVNKFSQSTPSMQ